MILGIAGTLASGKGTVVEYLKSQGFAHYSVSGILKEILTERGLPLTREYMSPLADELAHKYSGGVLEVAHNRAKESGVENYILESIHRESEAEYVRSIGGKVLGVDADLKIRYARTQSRKEGAKDEVTFEEFVEHTRREEEGAGGTGPNIRAILTSADALVINDGSLEELHAQVDRALVTLHLK
jgi:dephospho-CoA kinase